MKISAKGRYALRMMVDLALHRNGDFVSLKDISERQNVSMKYLEQIASTLNRAGFLHSVRGAQGGYHLARNPEEYTVGEILSATEGCMAPVACLLDTPNACPRRDICSTIAFWEELHQVISDFLFSKTLADVMKSGGILEEERQREWA